MAQGLLGGVLPAIYSGADQLKRGVYGLLTNPQEQAQRAAQSLLQSRAERQALMGQAFANPDRPFQVTNPQALSQLGTDVLTGELGIAPVGMIAYHGSPFKFDRFDLTKMGTGEGQQLYGKGMYYSESPSVSNKYRGSDDVQIIANGMVTDSPVAKQIARYGGNPQAYIDLLEKKAAQQKQALEKASKEEVLPNISDYDIAKFDLDATLKNIEEAKSYKSVKSEQVGSLYKVDIPDEDIPKMLDYDKPIKDQPEIFDLIKNSITDPAIKNSFIYNADRGISGGNAYQNYVSGKTATQKSENALNLGIKGIRYLDEGSRVEGKEVSNFVVFDPTNVKMLERNNEPLEGLLD